MSVCLSVCLSDTCMDSITYPSPPVLVIGLLKYGILQLGNANTLSKNTMIRFVGVVWVWFNTPLPARYGVWLITVLEQEEPQFLMTDN